MGIETPLDKKVSQPRVLACQHGARRRYAVPRMLEQGGVLNAFYTDSSASSALGKFSAQFGSHAPQVMQRLANRKIRGVPDHKIYSSDAYNFYEFGQKLLRSKKRGLELFRQRDQMFSRTMKRWGLQKANIVYSMYHENLDFIRWAKSQGLAVVLDVYINPMTHALMVDEFAEFPHWGGCPDNPSILLEEQMWKDAAAQADLLICPSEWVASGVRTLTPAATEKIRIVPYGCSIDYGGQTNQPVAGRVLFAGGYPLRKGLRYLAQAATQLKDSVPELDIRIAGLFPPEVVNHPICKDLNFLGKLSSSQMQQEYLSADCFVLPSLSEGFAGVVAEAIGAGCPVLVTPESGSPIVDGREGLIFPARNVEALADAIQRMVGDRALRQQCSFQCLEQASFYSEKEWQARLIPAVLSAAPEAVL